MSVSRNVPASDLSPGDWIAGTTFDGSRVRGTFERLGRWIGREHREIVVDGATYEVWDGDGFTVTRVN